MAKKIGEILVENGTIDQEQYKKALRYQQQNKCSLGDAIVKLGFASEEGITLAMSKQFGVPYASKENKVLNPERDQNLQELVSENYARENLIIPLFIEDDVMAIAMYDPSNIFVVDNIKMMTGKEIQPFIASKSQILSVIDAFYGVKDLLEEAVKDDDEDQGDVEVNVGEKLDLDKISSGMVSSIKLVNAILKQAISERASDIHLELFDEQVSLRFRIDGALHERTSPPKDSVAAIISRIKILSKLDISERRLPQDGSFGIKFQNRAIEIRVSVCPAVYGEKLVLRILDRGTSELNIESLGFEKEQKKIFIDAAKSPHGLMFLTGPTGSGKTTTLNAVLNTIKTPELNFMTLEDPVEYKLAGISQVQVKPQIGLTFATGLRSFLRQDPDVILVGEVRDQETAEACLKAALTGHLVLSTLHTNDALGAIPRLIDMGMEPFLLSSSLEVVAAQRLVRILCPHCKVQHNPSEEVKKQIVAENPTIKAEQSNTWKFYKEVGCPKCSETGYLGRKAIYEVYKITEDMRNIIYKTQDLVELRKVVEKTAVWNLRASAWSKFIKGEITEQEVFKTTVSKED